MKRLSHLLTIVRANSLVIISLMTILICTQQIQYNQIRLESMNEVQDEPQDDEGQDSNKMTLLDIDQNIIASNVQFHVSHVFYEIMDIEQDEVEDLWEDHEVISIPDNYRKVLFSQVISPNGP